MLIQCEDSSEVWPGMSLSVLWVTGRNMKEIVGKATSHYSLLLDAKLLATCLPHNLLFHHVSSRGFTEK